MEVNVAYNEIINENVNEENEEEEEEEQPAAAVEPPAKRAKPDWEICGLVSRQQERVELGLPSNNRTTCFGCIYVGEMDQSILRFTKIVEIIDMIRKNIARTDIINLVTQVALRYAELRHDVNSNIILGQAELPEWNAAMILDHIRYHNTDPELQTWIRLTEIQEVIKISLNASVEHDANTGEKRINPQQFRIYQDSVKLSYHVGKMEPSKMLFKSNESYLDMKAACQPIVATTNKKIVDYFT